MPSPDPARGTDPAAALYSIESHSGDAGRDQRNDPVAREEPLELRFAGRPMTVLMRTPGQDEELVRGFLFAEGIIQTAQDVIAMNRPEGLPVPLAGNVLDVHFATQDGRTALDRAFFSSSSCGVCGKRTIASLEIGSAPVRSATCVSRTTLGLLPPLLRAAQATFERTGGVHASGLFSDQGELLAVREDVGRHNALDKLIGWALNERLLPLDRHLLLVSGRASYELVQKAVMASIPIVAAVGAPSSLAIDTACRFQITLVGFLRSSSMNVYSEGWRITP
jgi:FdhD protein